MITTHFVPFGAQTKFTLRGPAPELSIHVNKLMNFGMFTEEALPSSYNPETDETVIVAATTARIPQVLEAMAEVDLSENKAYRALFKGKAGGFAAVLPGEAQAEANRIRNSWVRVNDEVLEPANGARDSVLPVTPEENTPEFRHAKQVVLGAIRARK